MPRLHLTFLLLFVAQQLFAQFELRGYASYMPSGCIMLTPDERYAEGIAYSTTMLNLNGYFEITFDIYLGDKDSLGADGITFVIHNDSRAYDAFGTYGEGMGYGRFNASFASGNFIAPSVAVEFDTYQNRNQNDPPSDHVAYLENGSSFHETYWNNNDPNYNLEDDRLHDFRFRWDPESMEITVFLDGNIVYQGQRNLVRDVFNGQTQVIWGFTASTGMKYNLQYFCLRQIAYQKEASKLAVPEKLEAE